MANIEYDIATKQWFVGHPETETTVEKCEYCGLFHKPTLGHNCDKAPIEEQNKGNKGKTKQ